MKSEKEILREIRAVKDIDVREYKRGYIEFDEFKELVRYFIEEDRDIDEIEYIVYKELGEKEDKQKVIGKMRKEIKEIASKCEDYIIQMDIELSMYNAHIAEVRDNENRYLIIYRELL